MRRNIIWDLEGTLIDSTYNPVSHPEAELVLKRPREDFYGVFLWTLAPAVKAIRILTEKSWMTYFNIVIGTEEKNGIQRGAIWINKKGQMIKKERAIPKERHITKDMRALGNPIEYVLIDDIMRPTSEQVRVICDIYGLATPNLNGLDEIKNGCPTERVIHIESYRTGINPHCPPLIQAYEQALKRF